jgi:hypothetical protein
VICEVETEWLPFHLDLELHSQTIPITILLLNVNLRLPYEICTGSSGLREADPTK